MMDYQAGNGLPSRVALGLACLLLLASFEPGQAERLRLTLNRRRVDDALRHNVPEVDLAAAQNVTEATEEASALQAGQSVLSEVTEEAAASAEIPSDDPLKNISMLQALALNSTDLNADEKSKSVLAVASAFSDHLHSAARATACGEASLPEEPSELTELIMKRRRCRYSYNPVVVIDGGSTATRGVLFKVQAESCPRVGRKILPDSILFLEEGKKFAGLRQTMEKWLDENAGPEWASKPYDAVALLKKYSSMIDTGRELMNSILENSAEMIAKHFNEYEQQEVKTLGVPVFLFSTAGVRDTHDWFRRGFFNAYIMAINRYNGSHGINFFTNEDWARPIPGVEEGMLAFTAANQLLGNFSILKDLKQALERTTSPEERKQLEKDMRQSLVSIIEVGGASAQVVFPVFTVGSSPSFVNVTNLTQAGYVSDDYPSIDIMSTSYMQLGASSATGIFYKSFCSNPANQKNGVCFNPCLPKDFKQECSTGEVTISPDGTVTVAKSIQKQRLKPAAYYCTSSNDEIGKKALNRLSCLAAGINPDEKLEDRLAIENCKTMEGTGDFEKCSAAVSSILLDPPLPLPGNQEASYTGFDTLGQIFDFMATGSPVVVTGKALVMPVKDLTEMGLLPESFKGDPCQLRDAAKTYCSAPVVSTSEGLFRRVDVGGTIKELPITSFNLESCLKLGMSHGILTLLNKSKIHPSTVSFSIDIEDPKTGEKVGEYGWPPGAILRSILDVQRWARDAYVLGVNHTVLDRWDEAHPAKQEVKSESA